MDDLLATQSQPQNPQTVPQPGHSSPMTPIGQQQPAQVSQPPTQQPVVPTSQPAVPVSQPATPSPQQVQQPQNIPQATVQPPQPTVSQNDSVPTDSSAQGIGVHKEFEPMSMASEYNEPLIVNSEPEVVLPPELKEVGVEEGEDVKEQAFFKAMQKASAELGTNEQQQQGGSLGGGGLPTKALPMSYEDAIVTKKKGKIWDSVTWLAALVAYQWKKLHPVTNSQ